jgi:hypothetical protein
MPKHVGFEVLTPVVMKSTIFWDITPCSPLKVNRRFGWTYRLHYQSRRISQIRNQREENSKQSLKIEEICSSETSVDLQRTKRRYIPEDRTLNSETYSNVCTKRKRRSNKTLKRCNEVGIGLTAKTIKWERRWCSSKAVYSQYSHISARPCITSI